MFLIVDEDGERQYWVSTSPLKLHLRVIRSDGSLLNIDTCLKLGETLLNSSPLLRTEVMRQSTG